MHSIAGISWGLPQRPAFLLLSSSQPLVRWLQEEQEARAEEEQFPDPEAVERKRADQAEKWRLQQLKAGTAPEDNANFQVGCCCISSCAKQNSALACNV